MPGKIKNWPNWLMGFHWFIFLAAVLIKLQIQLFIFKSTFDLDSRNYGTFCRQFLIFSLVVTWAGGQLEDCCKTGKGEHAQNTFLVANTKIHKQKFTKNSITWKSKFSNYWCWMIQLVQSGLKPNIVGLLNVRVVLGWHTKACQVLLDKKKKRKCAMLLKEINPNLT